MASFQPIIQSALKGISRNKGLSVSAVIILTITTILVTGLFMFYGIAQYLIGSVQNKIDITAYFKTDAQESDILHTKDQLQKQFPAIKSIDYISKDQAYNNFVAKHQNDQALSTALQEVGDNPFLPSLNINVGGDASQYAQIASYLGQDQFSSLVDRVDFYQKQDIINNILSTTKRINLFGLILIVVLALAASALVFNAVRLVLETSKGEIATMRAIGASLLFIRLPYIIEGALLGLIAFAIAFALTVVVSLAASKSLSALVPGFNLFLWLVANLFLVIIIQLIFSIFLGAASSYLALRKYLKS